MSPYFNSYVFFLKNFTQTSEEPIVLPLGTEVSAKYRGAFCEAKIKKIIKCVKCRVSISCKLPKTVICFKILEFNIYMILGLTYKVTTLFCRLRLKIPIST